MSLLTNTYRSRSTGVDEVAGFVTPVTEVAGRGRTSWVLGLDITGIKKDNIEEYMHFHLDLLAKVNFHSKLNI